MFYNYALVCKDIPQTLVNGQCLEKSAEPINIEKARKQHNDYLDALRASNVKLIEIEPDNKYPDCVFVEDIAVAVKNRIFLTNPGHVTRRGEVQRGEKVLTELSQKLNLHLGGVKNRNTAFLDGGDCLFTGREFIIGLSTRTNIEGVEELARFFHDIPVITCCVTKNLHLKSCISMLDVDTIIAGQSSKSILEQIEQKSSFFKHYKFVHVDSDHSANLLNINGNIIYAPGGNYQDIEEFKRRSDKSLMPVELSEFAKIDGLLTCSSVLFSSDVA